MLSLNSWGNFVDAMAYRIEGVGKAKDSNGWGQLQFGGFGGGSGGCSTRVPWCSYCRGALGRAPSTCGVRVTMGQGVMVGSSSKGM